MADVNSTKIISLANLEAYDALIKAKIEAGDAAVDAKSLKCGAVVGDAVYFFKTDAVPTVEGGAVDTTKAAFSFDISSSDVTSLKTRVGLDSTLNAYQSKSNVTDIVNVLTGSDSTEGSLAKVAKDASTAVSTLENGQVKTNKEAIEAINNAETGILKTAKDYTDTLANGAVATNTAAIAAINNTETGILKTAKDYTDTLANGQVKTNKEAIEAINDATTGILKTAENYTDTEVKKVTDSIGTVPTGSTVIAEIAAAKKAGDDAQADIDAYETANNARVKAVEDDVDAIETTLGDMTKVTTTSKEVAGAITELKSAVDTAKSAGEVYLDTAETATEGYLKTYVISQGKDAEGKKIEVGKIDIPKELVVTAGEVVKDPEGQPAGTYIKLTIANQTDPIFINVKDLVDIYTAAQSATQVQVAISDTNVVSATLVAGGVGTTELADAAVTTAKIADKNVTKDKLSDTLQTSIDAADSAVQKSEVVTGDTNGTIKVQDTEVAVKGLDTAAYVTVDSLNTTAQGYATTAETNAKSYADNLYAISTSEDINKLFATKTQE